MMGMYYCLEVGHNADGKKAMPLIAVGRNFAELPEPELLGRV